MRSKHLLIILVLAGLLLGAESVLGQGCPNPTNYYGFGTVDGLELPTGTIVWMESSGRNVSTDGWTDSTNYTLYNASNPTETQSYFLHLQYQSLPDCTYGADNGNTVSVYVAGYLADTLTANTSDTNVELNLSINDTTNPGAPSSFSGLETVPGVVNLSWAPAQDDVGVRKYLIYRGASSGVTKGTGTNIGNTTDINFTDSGLTPDGATYYYVVTAMDSANEGSESNEAGVTVTDISPPSAPTGLAVADIALAEGSLNLTWNANSESDINNYLIYFSTDNTNFILEAATANTYYEDSSLTDGSLYYYKIAANDTSGNPSFNTSTVSAAPVDDLAPDPVTGLSAADVPNNEGTLNITFTASGSSDAAGYLVYRNGTFLLNLTPKTNISFLDSVSDGQSYLYELSAYDEVPNFAANVSASGSSVDDLAPGQVTGLVAAANNHSVNLSWNEVTANGDSSLITDLLGYRVYWNQSGTWEVFATTSSLYYFNNSLTNQVVYQFMVAAYDDDANEGQNSTVVSATPSERPLITSSQADGTTFKSAVIVNISITSGTNLDTVYYRIYNSTGGQLSDSQINTSVGVTAWTYSISPAAWLEGDVHKVYVFANDTNGQEIQQNFSYTTDDTKPAVSSGAVSDGDAIVRSSDTFQLNVTIVDASSISSITAANDSAVSLTLLSGNIYSANTNASALGCPDSDGICKITFNATDEAGNYNDTLTLTLTIDDVSPSVTAVVISDTDSIVKSTDSFDINVTVTDTNSVSYVNVSISGGASLGMTNVFPPTNYNRTTTAAALGCSEGVCTLRFMAVDTAGNSNITTTYQITVDDTAPSISSVSISDDYVQNVTEVAVTVVVNDSLTSVASVTAEGVNLLNQGSGVWNGSVNLTDIDNAVNVTAIDAAGNMRTDNAKIFTIDDVLPVIYQAWFSDDYVQNNTLVTLYVNVSDQNLSSFSASTKYTGRSGGGGGSIAFDQGIFNQSIILSADMYNTTLSFCDEADNCQGVTLYNGTNFTIDDLAPSINRVALSDDYVRPNEVVAITVNVTDQNTTSVAADGTLLNFSSQDIWSGTLTLGTSSGVVSIVATDAAGNTHTDNASAYTVDSTSPTFSIVIPQNGESYTNADGNITFNFTVIENNLSRLNVSLDHGRNTYSSTANGSHTPGFNGLLAGTHTVTFTAQDNALNNATAVTRTFTIVRPLNATAALLDLSAALGTGLVNVSLYKNKEDVSRNETLDLNTSLRLKLRVNASGTNISVEIPRFSGLDASWVETFSLDSNKSSLRGQMVASRSGLGIINMVLFQNATKFLDSSQFTNGAMVAFFSQLADLNMLFIGDDEGETTYVLNECSSVPTGTITTANMCYSNNTANVTLYIPHFSGGALGNDTSDPAITINAPSGTASDSFFDVNFTVYEANPSTGKFCNYTITNATTVVHADQSIAAADMGNNGSTAYFYSEAVTNVNNGNYNLTVTCTDLKNQTNTSVQAFTVSDTTPPTISAKGPSGSQSTTAASLDVSLTATTNELAVCKYSAANVSYGAMATYLGSSTTPALGHTKSLSYTADDASETYYVLCSDVSGNNMTTASLISFSVDVGAGTTTSSSTSSVSRDISVTSTLNYELRTWTNTVSGGSYVMDITKDSISIKKLVFELGDNTTDWLKLKVAKLEAKPDSIAEPGAAAIYQYLQIEVFPAASSARSAAITFSVEKSWLSKIGADSSQVVLLRYLGEAWQSLPTSKTGETSTHFTFEAASPGFSYFAVAIQEKIVEEPSVPPVPEIVQEPELAEPKTEPQAAVVQEPAPKVKPQKQSNLPFLLVLMLGGLIAAAGIGYEVKIRRDLHQQMKDHGVNIPHDDLEKLESYIENSMAEGIEMPRIKRLLLKTGWQEEIVDKAIKDVFTKEDAEQE